MKALQKMVVQWVQESFVYKLFYFGSFPVTSSAFLFINLVMDLAALLELDGLKWIFQLKWFYNSNYLYPNETQLF